MLCVECHTRKTGEEDIPAIAKSNRVLLREAGLIKSRQHPHMEIAMTDIVERVRGGVEFHEQVEAADKIEQLGAMQGIFASYTEMVSIPSI